MRLTPKELERTTIFTVAEMARRRRGRGIKLNHPEAVEAGTRVLSKSDVMDGVPELVRPIKVEAGFESGTKLIVVADPIQ